MSIVDTKAVSGLALTAGSAGSSWIEIVEPLTSLFITVVVGGLTAWYTWERAMKLRRERKKQEKE
jgi:hypothetical protein